MALSDDEWKLIHLDPATNYELLDHHAGIARQADDVQPLFVCELEHLETQMHVRFTIRISPAQLTAITSAFTAMVADLTGSDDR